MIWLSERLPNALVQPYHEYPRFSTLPLEVLAELLTFTSPEYQIQIAGDLPLYKTYSKHNTGEEDTFFRLIEKFNYNWTILKGCQGDWVVEKIRKAAEVWRQIQKENEGDNGNNDNIIGDPFPYLDAVEILKNQKLLDKELLFSLPGF